MKTTYPNKPFLSKDQFLKEICKQQLPVERLIESIQHIAVYLRGNDNGESADILADAVTMYRQEMKISEKIREAMK